MKKIGILTYFRDENAGTFLQAYAMQGLIRNRWPDHHVELIDCSDRAERFRFRKGHLHLKRLLEEFRHYRVFRRSRKRYLALGPTRTVSHDAQALINGIAQQDYDLVIVGSDTVFDVYRRGTLTESLPTLMFWLGPEIKAKKVAFAVSSSALEVDRIDATLQERLRDRINAFDLVGVRDEATQHLIQGLGFRGRSKLHGVPDPTFGLDIDETGIGLWLARKGVNPGRTAMLVNLPWRWGPCRGIIKHFRVRGIQVVSPGYNPYADVCLLDYSPFEWAGMYRHFRLTVTDRYHGSIFSLRGACPVVAVDLAQQRVTSRGLSKTYCLMRDFGLHETCHVRFMEPSQDREVIQKAEQAMVAFDEQAVQAAVREQKDQLDQFLNEIDRII